MEAGAQAAGTLIFEPLALLFFCFFSSNCRGRSFNLEAFCVANICMHSLEYENVCFKRESQITIQDKI